MRMEPRKVCLRRSGTKIIRDSHATEVLLLADGFLALVSKPPLTGPQVLSTNHLIYSQIFKLLPNIYSVFYDITRLAIY